MSRNEHLSYSRLPDRPTRVSTARCCPGSRRRLYRRSWSSSPSRHRFIGVSVPLPAAEAGWFSATGFQCFVTGEDGWAVRERRRASNGAISSFIWLIKRLSDCRVSSWICASSCGFWLTASYRASSDRSLARVTSTSRSFLDGRSRDAGREPAGNRFDGGAESEVRCILPGTQRTFSARKSALPSR